MLALGRVSSVDFIDEAVESPQDIHSLALVTWRIVPGLVSG